MAQIDGGFPAGQGAKLMVLISDGDDQDAYAQEAAKAIRALGEIKDLTWIRVMYAYPHTGEYDQRPRCVVGR